MIEKRCTNCKHFFTSEKEYPCIDCIDNTGFIKWEPDEEMQIKEEKNCETCRHKQVNLDLEPCVRCVNGDGYEIRWEPNEQEQGIKKRCSDCENYNTMFYEEPCATCINTEGHPGWKPAEGTEIKLEKRPELLPRPFPIYEHTDSEIPERIRISFTNGTSAIYDLHTDQPAPVIIENIKIIRRMKQGYVNQPARRRRRK